MAENAENDPGPVGGVAAPLMAHHQRLDATTRREVVYCHSCQAEWWRDENGIMPCPSCGQEITEIVDPNSDIRPPPVPAHPPRRDMPASQSNTMNNADRQHDGNTSDPEEDDIRFLIGNIPPVPQADSEQNPRRRPRADSDEQRPREETASAFGTLLQGLLGPTLAARRPRTPSSQPQSGNGNTPNNSNAAPMPNPYRPTVPFGLFGPPGGQRPGSVVTTRIVLSNGQGPPVTHVYGNMPGNEPVPDLALMFMQMMANIGGPNSPGSPGAEGINPFQGILASLLNPGGAVHGDAVYTQEALDRVITQLMEQHQSSGAAPPAPREAIDKLPLKKADEKMVGVEGKASCPVCMEDVVLDDEVIELPCKHWFHEECAKSWLNEHNTCPICRKPISEDAPHEHGRADQTGMPGGFPSSNTSQTEPPPLYAAPPFIWANSGPRRPSNESRSDRLNLIRRTGGITYDEEHPPSIPGAFAYSPPTERVASPSRRPADGTPGGRSFADPSSGAFMDFLNAPPTRRPVSSLRGREDDDRHGAQRAGHRLRRENSYPLAHERSPVSAAHNPYVDTYDGNGRRERENERPGEDADSWHTTHSAGSRGSGSNASGGGGGGGGGIGSVIGGLWRRFSGHGNNSQNGSGSGNGNGQGR